MHLSRRDILMSGATFTAWSCAGPGGAGPSPGGTSGTPGDRLPEGRAGFFTGGTSGQWRVEEVRGVRGEPLASVPFLAVGPSPGEGAWVLRGVSSNTRYTTRAEKGPLDRSSEGLGRPEATRAALIPIRKNAAWWAMTQDERRLVFEEQSHHIADSMPYLPRIARKLYHCRDLGEPFDFLTWFEFAPDHEDAFDALLATLRGRAEWTFVDREVDVRLVRVAG